MAMVETFRPVATATENVGLRRNRPFVGARKPSLLCRGRWVMETDWIQVENQESGHSLRRSAPWSHHEDRTNEDSARGHAVRCQSPV